MVEMEEEKLELPVQQVLHLPFAALQLIKQHQPHPTYQQPQRPLQHLQHKQQQQQQQSNKQQQTREHNDEQATDDIPTRASAISNDATNENTGAAVQRGIQAINIQKQWYALEPQELDECKRKNLSKIEVQRVDFEADLVANLKHCLQGFDSSHTSSLATNMNDLFPAMTSSKISPANSLDHKTTATTPTTSISTTTLKLSCTDRGSNSSNSSSIDNGSSKSGGSSTSGGSSISGGGSSMNGSSSISNRSADSSSRSDGCGSGSNDVSCSSYHTVESRDRYDSCLHDHIDSVLEDNDVLVVDDDEEEEEEEDENDEVVVTANDNNNVEKFTKKTVPNNNGSFGVDRTGGGNVAGRGGYAGMQGTRHEGFNDRERPPGYKFKENHMRFQYDKHNHIIIDKTNVKDVNGEDDDDEDDNDEEDYTSSSEGDWSDDDEEEEDEEEGDDGHEEDNEDEAEERIQTKIGSFCKAKKVEKAECLKGGAKLM